MADKRMFTKTIIDSDAFLDMPLSTQCLYFHLVIRANENGFLNNAKSICKIIGCNDIDINKLVIANFIARHKDGIYEIKNWDFIIGRGETAKKRLTYKYRKWRENVLIRDDYTCKHCGTKIELEVHHIKKFSEFEDERYEINNGVTLCKQCHMELHRLERCKVNGRC